MRGRLAIAGGALAIVGVVVAGIWVGRSVLESALTPDFGPAEGAAPDATSEVRAEDYQGFLYGRVTTADGAVVEGRLRFGGDEEAFWDHTFNAFKPDNPWAALAPPEELTETRPVEVLGMEVTKRERRIDVERPYQARFGDIARIEAHSRALQVTLKSGTTIQLDRFAADDFADGIRVWDEARGVVDLGERRVRSIELLPTPPLSPVQKRLFGTVRTRQGEFTGFIQWNRQQCLGADGLRGESADGEVAVRFDTMRSIARHGADSSEVTLRDGRVITLSGSREAGRGNRGLYVDDRRYGRVLVSWEVFERVDFGEGGSGPAYDDFPPGRPLAGTVITRAGRRLAGRLVFDLDESETTDMLDAPVGGVDYTIPFGLVAAIERPGEPDSGPVGVRLHRGEELRLEPRGDLGEQNAGVLVFVSGRELPEYVRWAEVARIELERPPAMFPPLGDPLR